MLSEREFNKLLLKYKPYVISQVVSRRIPGELEDNVQEMILRACTYRHNYDPNRGSFASFLWWLILARSNELRAQARRREHINMSMELFEDGRPVVEALAVGNDPHEALELDDVFNAVSELKPRLADVIMRRAVGDTFVEIAAEQCVSVQRMQQLHSSGIKKIRQRLCLEAA